MRFISAVNGSGRSRPTLALSWPPTPGGPVVSDKDLLPPGLAEFQSLCEYDGVPLEPL